MNLLQKRQQRKDLIEKITSELHRNYDVRNLDSLRKASEDRGIIVIENNKVIIPTALYHNPSAKWFILTRKFLSEKVGLSCFAHEMGHALLDHRHATTNSVGITKEQVELEAELFQKQLGYNKLPKLESVIDIWYTFATRPLTSTRWIFSPSFQRDYDMQLISDYIMA